VLVGSLGARGIASVPAGTDLAPRARAMTTPTKRGPTTPRVPNKNEALEPFREYPEHQVLTTDQGIPIPHTDDSLKAGERGPSLLEDFHLREKITRFDHERIPERVVHARGSGAHGYFQVYESLEDLTQAGFLTDPQRVTPVFVRFSTVQGSRGSADTVRDVRGFAVKFYTDEGNFDLVGNNIPVFFIQDGIKFPDVVHAVKPEPHNEMPQGASAHDNFWDFVSLQPETAHMVMWVMSDRGIPRSYRMMEGFGVHTFKLVNARGQVRLCKFHWKPLLGVHSLVWDEAQKIIGKDSDFHRRDLWEAIDAGQFPEYELGLQIIDEKDELAFGFDLIDPTKLLPEELVPVRRVGKLTLNRNPQNFFAETEQVAFCVANVVPGIDFTNDPLMQARLFSYLDTQLTRLGGPNFHELPINRPVAPVHNHQQDGFGRQTISAGRANYHPNSVGLGCPFLASAERGFVHAAEPTEGVKTRTRAETFSDHFSQARMFLDSQSEAERRHLVEAFQFEVGKVERATIRERVIEVFAQVDADFAREIADGLGIAFDGKRGGRDKAPGPGAVKGKKAVTASPALSMANTAKDTILSRRVAILCEDGVDAEQIAQVKAALRKQGAACEVISRALGTLTAADGGAVAVDRSYLIAASVLYDAVFVPGGEASVAALSAEPYVEEFLQETFHHCKPIAASGEGVALLEMCGLPGVGLAGEDGESGGLVIDQGVVTTRGAEVKALADAFIISIAQHRHFERTTRPGGGGVPIARHRSA
jgi:catalase